MAALHASSCACGVRHNHRHLRSRCLSRSSPSLRCAAFGSRGAASGSSSSVRPARQGEVQAIAALFVAEFFFKGKPDQYDGSEVRALVQAQAADMRKRYFGSRYDAALLVVEDEDGEIVACGGVSVTPRDADGVFAFGVDAPTPTNGGSTAPVIANVAVASSARRRGYGKKIMAALEDQCREWQSPESWLLVELRNGKAQSLYRKLGYVSTKLVRAVAFELGSDGKVVGGEPRTLYMRKVLNPLLGLVLNRDPFTPTNLALGVVVAVAYASGATLSTDDLYQWLVENIDINKIGSTN